MKTSWIALAALACSVGVTPIVSAQTEPEPANAAAIAPVLSSGVQPVSHVEARYPLSELRAHANGECTVLFDVAATGEVENVRTASCSSRDFAREARRVARSLRYPADAMPPGGLRDQSFKIRWEGEAG